jgi:hypothetical protein
MARTHWRLKPKAGHGCTRGGFERRRLFLGRGAGNARRRLDRVQSTTQLDMGDKDVAYNLWVSCLPFYRKEPTKFLEEIVRVFLFRIRIAQFLQVLNAFLG